MTGTENSQVPVSAIILAGGRASRLGGVPKSDIAIGGAPMLDRVVAACWDHGIGDLVVVGDLSCPYRTVCEDPPRSGPANGILAGLGAIGGTWTLLLSCDIPFIAGALPDLLAGRQNEGACIGGQRPQYLAGIYRTDALRRACADLAAERDGTLVGAPVHALIAKLDITVLPPSDAAADVDTWEDVARARQVAAEEQRR
ncbi:MAG: molybdenum cofactor guanylyltransferase [Flaviflexus sp.]|nr:molybdenum cofactor guanylyltransferase [Flaviflexus sp.]